MKLYHFTNQKHLFGITIGGLEPQIYDDVPTLTMGQPVVWLTTQETLTPTEDDLAFMRDAAECSLEEISEFKETLLPGRDLRLTVNLDPLLHKKKLFHYRTWLRETKIKMCAGDADHLGQDRIILTGRDILATTLPAAEHWWIYFGTIKPARIELNPTAGRMLPSIEHNLADAIEEGNADRIARLTEIRDRVLAAPPEALLDITVAA